MDKAGGNVSAVARAFGVRRSAVYEWLQFPDYKQVLDDARGSFLDEALTSARMLVRGIPDIQNGKQVGWITPPDSGMTRYILGTLGRNEGFGEKIEVDTKVNLKDEYQMTPAEAKEQLHRVELAAYGRILTEEEEDAIVDRLLEGDDSLLPKKL